MPHLADEEFEEYRAKMLYTPANVQGFIALFTVSRTEDKPAVNSVTGPNFFDRKKVSGGRDEFRHTKVNRYVADLSYDFSSDWTLQSVTSFVDTKRTINSPRTSTFFREGNGETGVFAQDFRLTYDNPDSNLSGLIGLYAGNVSRSGDSAIDVDVFGIGTTIPMQRLKTDSDNSTFAIYADGRYTLSDKWTLLSGGRLLHDKVENNPSGFILPSTPLEVSLDQKSKKSNTEFLPKVGVAYALSDTQNIALTVSKSYRQGFIENIIGTSEFSDVDPESLWSYELAYRSSWLDDRLTVNGNIFYYDYTINADQAHSYGAELDAQLSLDSGLDLYAGLGLVKTEFDNATFNGGSISGNEFPDAPSVTAALGAVYKHHSGWFVGGDIAYTDSFFSKGAVTNNNTQALDAFTLVNAQAGYEGEHFKFIAYVKNHAERRIPDKHRASWHYCWRR